MKLKMKHRSHRCDINDINSPRPRHGHKYIKFKMCLSIIIVICVKQHVSLIHEKAKQH